MSFTFYVYCTYYISMLLCCTLRWICQGTPGYMMALINSFQKVFHCRRNWIPIVLTKRKRHTHTRSLLIQSQLCCGIAPSIFGSYIRWWTNSTELIWKFSDGNFPRTFHLLLLLFCGRNGIIIVKQFWIYVLNLWHVMVHMFVRYFECLNVCQHRPFIKFLNAKRSFNWIYHVKCSIRCLSAWDVCVYV